MFPFNFPPELYRIARKLGLGDPATASAGHYFPPKPALLWHFRLYDFITAGRCGPPKTCKDGACRRRGRCRMAELCDQTPLACKVQSSVMSELMRRLAMLDKQEVDEETRRRERALTS